MRCSIFITILLLIPQLGYGQLTQTVRGQVIDHYSEMPIPGAKVYLFSKTDTLRQLTDIDGYFRFENVAVGRYNLLASYAQYESAVLQNLEVISSKELILVVKMTEEVKNLDEVKVTAKKDVETVNQLSTVSARTFSIEESRRYAGSNNDVARMAQNFAGVQGADDSRNDIIIRGNSPSGVLYRMDGIDIPNPNHFARFGTTGGPVSMLNNNVLSNSDFFTGAFPAEYGNALSGVFDLRMRHGNNERYEFMGQVGFNGAELMAEGPLSKKKKSSFLVNYRYSTLEFFKLLGMNFGTVALPKYQDATFKLYFPSEKGVTSIFGMGGLSNINILSSDTEEENSIWGSTGTDIYFRSNTGVTGISHKHRINANSFFEIIGGIQGSINKVQNDTLDVNGANPFTTFNSNSNISRQTTIFNYQNKINSRNLIKAGIINDVYMLNFNDSIYENALIGLIPLRDFNGATDLVRGHFQHRFRWTENITLVSGVYGQLLSLSNQYSIEPRIGMNFKLPANQRISIGYGMHSQVAPLEVYFSQIRLLDGSFITPNKNLKFTRSQHLVASFQKGFKHGINLKVETYGQYLTNVPVDRQVSTYSLLNFGASFVTGTPDSLVNGGEGYNYGVEMTLEKSLNNGIYFLLTGSLFDSKYKGSDEVWRNTAFNGNHTLNVLGGYEYRFKSRSENPKYKSALTFDLKFTWNGGGRYTEILLDQSIQSGTQVLDEANTFARSYPDYMKGNARIGFKLIGKKATQEWACDFQNFTNRANIFYQEYNAYAGMIRTIYQNGFLAIFQYRITFGVVK